MKSLDHNPEKNIRKTFISDVKWPINVGFAELEFLSVKSHRHDTEQRSFKMSENV